MTKDEVVERYSDGERQCPICDEGLPGHRTWPGTRYRFCGKPECADAVRQLKCGRYIVENEKKCQAAGCSNFVPEGLWDARCKFVACSHECYQNRLSRGSILMTCGCGCGTTFFRASHRPNKHGLVFASSRHYGDFVANKLLEKSCGHFRAIADEYLNGIAKRHYREVRGARRALASLFLFLMERGITSLEEVSPQTITTYILWMNETGRKLGSDTLSCISTFFGWTISDGRRDKANPVTRWHRPPKKKRKPRPLKPYELETMWRLLIERGDARVCLAAALGQESGLRISEICRLEISDVDLEAQRLFVRLPNKSQTERYAFFGEKTTRYWHEWMHERRESCGHERALYNNIGTPYTRDTLADAFKRVLLKSEKGVDGDGDGFETWSTHRLRHTMASALVAGGADLATVMEAGGWLDPDTMTGYTEVSIEQARHGYDEAMRTFHKQKELPRQTRIVNADELLQIWATEDENEGALEKSADCV